MNWNQLKEILGQTNVELTEDAYDDDVHLLFDEVKKEKAEKEREQKIARFQHKQCFLEGDGEDGVISIREKFQLLANYYSRRFNAVAFQQVVEESIVREWITPIKIHNDLEPEEEAKTIYCDRAPLHLEIRRTENSRRSLPTYIIRILALVAALTKKTLQCGSASTEVYEMNDDYTFSKSPNFCLLQSNQEDNDNDEEGSSLRKRRKNDKRIKKENAEGSTAAFCSFTNLETDGRTGESSSSVKTSRKTPNIQAKDACVSFEFKNVVLAGRDQSRSCNQKYRLETEIHLKYNFGGQIIDISSSIASMPFELTTNHSVYWRSAFPFIWSILVDYYNENNGILRWKHVAEFLTHYLSSQSNVMIRKLTSSEVRTMQCMMLTRRFHEAILSRNPIDKPFTPSEREEIERRVFGRQVTTETGELSATDYIGKMQQKFYHDVLNDDVDITMEDFTKPCVHFFTLLPDDRQMHEQGHRVLNFSLYEWLHGVKEVLIGSHLHAAKSHTTIRIFNRHIISLRSSSSSKQIMTELMKKFPDNSDSVMLIRFDERALSTLAFEFAETATSIREGDRVVGRREAQCHKGALNARNIETRSFPVEHPRSAEDRNQHEKAVAAGVLNEKGHEATGLFAFFKSPYPAKFSRIFAGVAPESIEQGNKRVGKIVCIFGRRGVNTNPVYDFDLREARREWDEIDPLLGTQSVPCALNPHDEVVSIVSTLGSVNVTAHQSARLSTTIRRTYGSSNGNATSQPHNQPNNNQLPSLLPPSSSSQSNQSQSSEIQPPEDPFLPSILDDC